MLEQILLVYFGGVLYGLLIVFLRILFGKSWDWLAFLILVVGWPVGLPLALWGIPTLKRRLEVANLEDADA